MNYKTIGKELLRSRNLVLADQAIFSGSSLMLTVMLARLLLSDVFGGFSAVILFAYLLVSGLNALVIAPFQVSYATTADKSDYLSFLWTVNSLLTIVLASALVTMKYLLHAAHASFGEVPMGGLLFVVSFLTHDFLRKVGLVRAALHSVLFLDFLLALGQCAVVSYAYFHPDLTLNHLLFGLAVGYCPALVYGTIVGKFAGKPGLQWRRYAQSHFDQGKWLFTTAIVQWWSSNLFVIASGAFLGLAALGAFRLVQSLFGVLNLLLQTFENYVLPKAASMMANSPFTAKKYVLSVTKTAGVLFAVVLTALFCFSDQVMLIAGGAKYAAYGFVVKGMSLLYALIFIGYPIRMSIRLLILNRQIFIGYVLTLIFSVSTFSYLLQTWNLAGALMGLASAQLILLTYWQFTLHQQKFYLWK